MFAVVVRPGSALARALAEGVSVSTVYRRDRLDAVARAQLVADPPIDPSDPRFAEAPFSIVLKRGRWGAEVDSPHPAFNSLASLKAYARLSDDREVRALRYVH